MMSFLKRLFCRHKEKTCITNLYGDMVNMLSTGKHIYRSVWKCTRCGKCFYSEKLDPDCVIINWCNNKKGRCDNGNNLQN